MAHLIPNMLSSYFLTPEEQIEGAKLTTTQIQVIQNQIAELTQQKLLLTPPASNIQEYIQQESYLRGQIDSLTFLLTTSEALSQEQIEINTANTSNPTEE